MVPDYETLMLPLLELLADGLERSGSECRTALIAKFNSSEEDIAAQIPSGGNLWASRLHWAGTYLVKAGVLERPRRGFLRVTPRGIELLAAKLAKIDTALLETRYEEMRSWRRRANGVGTQPQIPIDLTDIPALSPEEALQASYAQIRDATEADLLQRAKTMPPENFEILVLDLLTKLGYSGPSGSAVHLGRTGDGGIDGVIRQDKLGLERIYVQAKRWQGSVGSPTVREFAGTLAAHRARKGVIITTSSFTADARADADRMSDRIVLVDGLELASLMYDVNLGVSVTSVYEVKRADSDYFDSFA